MARKVDQVLLLHLACLGRLHSLDLHDRQSPSQVMHDLRNVLCFSDTADPRRELRHLHALGNTAVFMLEPPRLCVENDMNVTRRAVDRHLRHRDFNVLLLHDVVVYPAILSDGANKKTPLSSVQAQDISTQSYRLDNTHSVTPLAAQHEGNAPGCSWHVRRRTFHAGTCSRTGEPAGCPL